MNIALGVLALVFVGAASYLAGRRRGLIRGYVMAREYAKASAQLTESLRSLEPLDDDFIIRLGEANESHTLH